MALTEEEAVQLTQLIAKISQLAAHNNTSILPEFSQVLKDHFNQSFMPFPKSATGDVVAEEGDLVLVDASSGIVTVTLSGVVSQGRWIVKKIDNTVNKVVVNGGGIEIDDVVNFDLLLQYEAVTIVSDGIKYYVV